MIAESIKRLAERRDLTRQEAYKAMSEIMAGQASEIQIAAFLMGLRIKGETVQEIAGCAEAMREKAVRISTSRADILDTCGTGGDTSGTFNISTTAAIIASAAGAAVAKHGNRAVTSRCGSADVLRGLGVNIDVSPERAGAILDAIGITFLFAPQMHQAVKYAMGVRKELATRTIFNILGPLVNPAGARRQLMGVFTPELTETLATVLGELGAEHALVVHGYGGLDEISTAGPTRVSELKEGRVNTYQVSGEELGIPLAAVSALKGGNVGENVEIVLAILRGRNGAPRDIAMLNAGAALYAAGKAADLREGLERAREALDSGAALQKLQEWKDASNAWSTENP